MADFLEYSDVSSEIKGSLTPGKLKMTDQHIIFKNSKTGKVDQISSSDFEAVNFQNFAGTWGIRVFLKNGTLHRYVGFRESEKEKIAKFFKNSYKIDMLEKELSLKGWNWGTAKFNGAVLSFDINDKTAFEIPLNHVSQCTGGKNEITMEFHQNDDAPVSLLEMRFFIPSTENAETDPVEAFQQQVMDKASVISVSGDAIAIFREIHCLTPRGRYDIKMFSSFFQLHGKTFDYKIPMSTVLRLFILPHKDGRQTFFVVSLDPPIKQGQTRYHFLVFLFQQEDNETLELPFTEEELKDKFEGKLEKEISGPTYEVLGRVMKNIANRKLTGPGGFIGHSGTPAVGCSFKAAAGYLYPLERGFMYVHKPPLHIRFEEIASVNFARGGGSTRSFDFEIELKSGTVHTFSSIEKEEYGKLFDFITSKKLNIKNRGKSDKNSYNDDFGNSDDEAAPDAYLERVKAEGQEKDSDDDDEDESTDEDFDPTSAKGGRDSDIAEEYDSNPTTSESDEDGEGGSGDEKKSKKKEKKHKSAKTVSEKPRKRKEKKDKDENQPKRPSTAFMMWLNATREQIKKDNPGIKVTEIAKKGGEMWRELKDKSEWEKKAAKEKEEYNKAMEEYRASGGGEKSTGSSKSAKKSKPSKKPSSPEKSGSFKSREFVEDSDSSDDEGETKKKKEVNKPAKKDGKKKKSDSSGSEADDEKPKKKEAKKPAKKEDKKKKSDSEKSEAESELEDEDKGKKRKKESDDEKSKKKTKKGGDKAAKSKKKESGSENDEDEEEILSTPPSSGASDESD